MDGHLPIPGGLFESADAQLSIKQRKAPQLVVAESVFMDQGHRVRFLGTRVVL